MTAEEAEEQIVTNLQEMHHCKPVNFLCAIKGIDDQKFAKAVLDEVITKGIVRVRHIKHRDRFGLFNTVSLYQYNGLPLF